MTIWHVQSWEDGLTLQELWRNRLPQASQGYVAKLLKSGKIQCNGQRAGAAALKHGDCICLPTSTRLQELCDTAPLHRSPILWEDRDFVVLLKPCALAVHPRLAGDRDNLLEHARQHYALLKAPYKIAPVHRLDLETSGPVLLGKGRAALGDLGKLFQRDALIKGYVALVRGPLEQEEGQISLPLLHKGAMRPARTDYRLLARGSQDIILLQLRLHTGRYHQIRRHLNQVGLPILGDKRYGNQKPACPHRLMLHCHRLCFPSPGEPSQQIDIRAPLPKDFRTLARQYGIAPDDLELSSGQSGAP